MMEYFMLSDYSFCTQIVLSELGHYFSGTRVKVQLLLYVCEMLLLNKLEALLAYVDHLIYFFNLLRGVW